MGRVREISSFRWFHTIGFRCPSNTPPFRPNTPPFCLSMRPLFMAPTTSCKTAAHKVTALAHILPLFPTVLFPPSIHWLPHAPSHRWPHAHICSSDTCG